MNLLDRITIDPEICHGKPAIQGLRYCERKCKSDPFAFSSSYAYSRNRQHNSAFAQHSVTTLPSPQILTSIRATKPG